MFIHTFQYFFFRFASAFDHIMVPHFCSCQKLLYMCLKNYCRYTHVMYIWYCNEIIFCTTCCDITQCCLLTVLSSCFFYTMASVVVHNLWKNICHISVHITVVSCPVSTLFAHCTPRCNHVIIVLGQQCVMCHTPLIHMTLHRSNALIT